MDDPAAAPGERDASPSQHYRQSRVAIIGTGLAGLTTAHLLHNDERKRYQVTLFEQSDRLSFDSASIAVRNEADGTVERVDLPMRASAGGYYANLMRMYAHLAIPLHPIRFLFIFAKALPPSSSLASATSAPGTYFVHASNLHQTPPPWPGTRAVIPHLLEILYLIVCQFWFTVVCFTVTPRRSEPLASYVDRVWLPKRYLSHYLLPLMASVSTCSHEEILAFPASDVVGYKKLSHGQQHYAVCGGVRQVQERLTDGLRDIRLASRVLEVVPRRNGHGGEGVAVRWRPLTGEEEEKEEEKEKEKEEVFDRVVLAVSPDVAARIFRPLQSTMGKIPIAWVESSVLQPNTKAAEAGSVSYRVVNDDDDEDDDECAARKRENENGGGGGVKGCMHHAYGGNTSAAQTITFRTRFAETETRTEVLHAMPSGVVVRTCPLDQDTDGKRVLQSAKFTRTLRSVEGRAVVQNLLGMDDGDDGEGGLYKKTTKKNLTTWVNGEDSVWITGAWCWDGMVLLEGCIVSAMRVARDFGVRIPWESDSPTRL